MLSLTLQEAAQAIGARLEGANARFQRVSTDTRTLQAGVLFVALRGERFDGHDFLSQALERGAAAALVEQFQPQVSDLPQLVVADSRLALGQLAAAWRARSGARVIGITGSNGKTTVKEMLRAIFSQGGAPLLATEGNLNNDIGLPLTLLRLQGEPLAIVEMGANHPGEIDYLSRLAQPECVLLNNAGRAHLEGFGSPEGVARAKAEIIHGLKPGGWFIYNADSPWAPLWRSLSEGLSRVGFGLSAEAEVRLLEQEVSTEWREDGFINRFQVDAFGQRLDIQLRLAGAHNRSNALAAIAAALKMGASGQQIQQGLATLEPVKGRLRSERVAGVYLVDDSYNANPDSVQAAIEVLRGAPGKRFLVLGDLGELGPEAVAMHASVGEVARRAAIDHVYATGPLSQHAVAAFGEGAIHFSSREVLARMLKQSVSSGDTVLVKGSRSAGMELVIELFKEAC